MANEPNKPDFSNVRDGAATSASKPSPKPNFGNVQAGTGPGPSSINTPAEKTYTVVSGDSLSKIAKHVYGDASRWHDIFNANRDLLDDPDKIKPGQILKLPAATDSKA